MARRASTRFVALAALVAFVLCHASTGPLLGSSNHLSAVSSSSSVQRHDRAFSLFPGAEAVELDGWEDDQAETFAAEDDGFEEPLKDDQAGKAVGGEGKAEGKAKPATHSATKSQAPQKPYVPWKERGFAYWVNLFDEFAKVVVNEHKGELVLLVVASLYALNYVIGSRRNESVVLEWANTFGLQHESTVYGKNFALVGLENKTSASEIIFRESQACFKCYATGRRYVNWVMTTLDLRKRQDLMSELINLVMPAKDKLVVDVSMTESAMDPMVFAIVKKKLAKRFVSEHKDVKKYATVVTDPQAILNTSKSTSDYTWPRRKLVVVSESKELFSMLVSEAVLKNVFDSKVYLKHFEKYFECMYVTSEGPVPGTEPTKNLLRFEFSLPSDTKKMGELHSLMEFMFHEIDLIGSQKLSPEASRKAQKRRKEVEAELFKESLASRQEAAARKREEKFNKEKSSMTPAQVAKAEEKRKNKILKKNRPKMKMK